jgi:hypothetical protein
MRADCVEVSWDAGKSKWIVRIQAGEEVVRRVFDAPKHADDETLRAAAQRTAQEEGYEPDVGQITVKR